MDQADFARAWNNFVSSNRTAVSGASDPRFAAYIAKTFMGLVSNGGLAFFVEYSEFEMSVVVSALKHIGAGKAARELESALERAEPVRSGETGESLSLEAETELHSALVAHVSSNLPVYLGDV